MSEPDTEDLANTFRLLGDRNRVAIILLLSQKKMNVTELCVQLKVPQSTVSHHLGLLRMGSVIDAKRVGKQVFYTLKNGGAIGVINAAIAASESK